MRYENKFWNRQGGVFSMSRETVDLSDVRILHVGVDTVKQLYNCLLKPDVCQLLEITQSGSVLNLGGIDWVLSRSSKQSGYQYILKNQNAGYVILVKSFYKEIDQLGPHLKIEVSPWVIHENTEKKLTANLAHFAKVFATDIQPSGVAVHIAADIKNMRVPEDFEKRFVCKAKKQFKFNIVSNAHFEGLNETSCVYGDRQSFTYGQVSAVQFCMYDKTAEIEAKDKRDFWHRVWYDTPSVENPFLSEFEPGDKVQRIELRFHHSVVAQFCNGTEEMADFSVHRTYERLVPHLTGLFKYGLDIFRLQYSTSYIDPLWQMLIQDVEVLHPDHGAHYKRAMKKPSLSTRRNVGFFLGNFIRIATRKQLLPDHIASTLLLFGIDSELADYFGVPLFGGNGALKMELINFIQKRMEQLTLDGVAA